MDNKNVPGLHAGGKRRREDTGELEDVKDAVKLQGRWTPRAEGKNPSINGFSVESWIRMQQQKSEVAGGVGGPALNLHQRAMAAAALQDLRCLETSKRLYQNQVSQQYQFQQHLSTSMQPMPTPESSNGSLRELSPGLLPQSPLCPPPPLIRTPPLYAEADLHNGSPTSSSSSPYPTLQNVPLSRTQSSGAALQMQDLSTDQIYTNIGQTSQNGAVNHHNHQQPQQVQQLHQQHCIQHQQVKHLQQQPTIQHQQQLQQTRHQHQVQQTRHPQPLQQQACSSDGNSPVLRELQQGNSWYTSTRDSCTYAEAMSGASSAGLLSRMEAPSHLGTQNVAPNFPLPTPDFSSPRLLPTYLTQPCQSQGVYRDGSHEQNLQPHFDSQSPVGISRRCPSPSSSRLGMCPPPQADAQCRRMLSGPSTSFGDAPLNPPAPMMLKTGLDDNSLLHRSMPCSIKPVRSFTKVYKLGSITRAVDVHRFTNYIDMRVELAHMFNLEGQLDQKLGWQLVFIDHENDLLLVGDDPWEDFVKSVRGIRILSPREVYFYMNEEAVNTSPSARQT